MLIFKRLIKGKSLNSTVAVNCAVKKEYMVYFIPYVPANISSQN